MTRQHSRSAAGQPSRATRAVLSRSQQGILDQVLRQAWAFYGQRDWGKAAQSCRLILQTVPDCFDALHLAGIVAAQSGRPREAAEFLRQAVAAKPAEPTVHNNFANALRDLGQFDEALEHYGRAASLNPLYAEAHYNRAVTLQGLRRHEEALSAYDRAIQINPDHASAYNNRGVVLKDLKRFEESLQSFARALAIQPDYAVACNNRGITLHELRRYEEALQAYERALALTPNYADALSNRGHALKELKRPQEALLAYDRALALNPSLAEAHNGRGSVLQLLKRPQEALLSYEQACLHRRDYPEAHFNCGNILWELQRLPDAVLCYERSLAINPRNQNVLQNLAIVLMELKRYAAAREVLQRAVGLQADYPWLFGWWLHLVTRTCAWEGLAGHIEDLRSRIRRGERASAPFTLIGLLDCPELQQHASRIWLEGQARPLQSLAPIGRRARGARIRIGYYSADFCDHATSSLAAGLFECHDRERFEVVGFDFSPKQRDAMTERLAAAFDRFLDVRGLSDVEVAQQSRDLGIDIAVDLKGYTKDQRMGIFTQRAAPVQVNFLGYPGTLAAEHIDYLIADARIIPEESRQFYTEKIAYLPNSYQVNDRRRAVAPVTPCRSEAGLPADAFVYCCLNAPYKILPSVFDSWMRILGRVEHSVLWLMEEDPEASENLRKQALARGVQAHRLVFARPLPMPEHLARYRLADLFLDTWPCNAHTTASDALWVELPVLTLPGRSFTSRVASSLLTTVGLPELIADNAAGYEDAAVSLAGNPRRMAELRRHLAAARLSTPLFDTVMYTRHLEEAFRQMYERYHAGQAPDHIFVPR